jgi:DNA-binding transcriptional LysR family regulator
MPRIKQVEAFFWSGQLGSFVAAAERLNTTQSNISKRIQELEYTLGVDLFDRSRRTVRLTPKGEEAMKVGEQLLHIHMKLRQMGTTTAALRGPFRFGVTEAVAVTWLPRFSALIKQSFNGLVPISTVDTTQNLNQLLMQRKIDLIIGSRRNLDSTLTMVELCNAERVWVASPSLVPHDNMLTAHDLARLPMLAHGDPSAQRVLIPRFLQSSGIEPNIVTSCTSMNALARMAIDGVGITYLHRDVFAADIDSSRLKVLKSEIAMPDIEYVAAYRDDVMNPVAALAARKAKDVCCFVNRGTLGQDKPQRRPSNRQPRPRGAQEVAHHGSL